MRTTWPTSSGTSFVDAPDLTGFDSWQKWLAAHQDQVLAQAENILLTTGQPIVTTWRCQGQVQTVQTYWNGTETSTQWVNRHFAAVDAAMANCPPS